MADYALHGADYIADPYPVYRQMAEKSPVWLQESTGHVYVSRYADVREVLLDPASFSNNRVADRLSRTSDSLPAQCLAAILHDRLVMTDGPPSRGPASSTRSVGSRVTSPGPRSSRMRCSGPRFGDARGWVELDLRTH